MNAEIVAIGTELLLGQIVDTNSAWIGQRFADNGIDLHYVSIVGDSRSRMLDTLKRAHGRSQVVITTGGIGPTQDDLTREIVAEMTGRKVVVDPESLIELAERFQKRGFILTKNNEKQAEIPEGAGIFRNPNGTAPAFCVEDGGAVIISLPGVPFEMKWLIDNEVIPYIKAKFNVTDVIRYRVLKTVDLGESSVDHLIGHLMKDDGNPAVGTMAHPGQVDVRIAARASSEDEAEELIGPIEEEIRNLLGDNIFATGDETLESLLGSLIADKGLTVATYEDLTGGAIADVFQQAAGAAFVEGNIVNSNKALERLARACGESLPFADGPERTAALSRAMRVVSGATLGVAVHAVEEGDQRTENLGRGETYIAVTDADGTHTRHVRSAGRGVPDRRRAALSSLSLVRRVLLGLDSPLGA
ncbi:MAG TPA: CinA family nicotinamide mononucleotide deamidase-related protein [Dehalococcoidia bacterium]|jgi:nicotinamide-nucleotide amidase|nr:CinA family nicotinamide mononucleotide deamidase-related protein [Dehalococcoidia bacterium]MDP7160766.1 CinA family nicotinamide mononucleotide deamidase-related protein [Dehalococcoidia bacterium]MDP7514008.1 CinA family nicotinamide mononucleotide deamidase-related protein [Dehalococcoidia bacterium]HJM54296.1 CinA family nicotinamide mononucleotide deamidase-related protein [Dehalococcoidia bacterium]|tara:strand:+ start:198 stop:1445 length:1248 start_codon:yes stop_codon:yes gene_type:complete